jgi:predicted DCC family thiol-disulfide oxidoreductase YuxK
VSRLVAKVIGKQRPFLPVPLAFHFGLAWGAEHSMTVPLIALAQVRILKEEVVEPSRAPDVLPSDLTPTTPFDEDSIRAGLPAPGPIALADFRWCSEIEGAGGDAVLVFDGDCGFCTTSATWAARKFRHGERAQAWQLLGKEFLDQHGMTLDDVQQAAWWVDGAGRERGHRAVGRALQAGGGLRRVVGWFVLSPPSSLLAAGIYRLVVRWRYRLPGGTPACKLDAKTPSP